MIMFIKIPFNYRGERTQFQGEWTHGVCVVRAPYRPLMICFKAFTFVWLLL